MSAQYSNGPRKPFLHRLIFVFAFVLGLETGAGAFTTVVVFPLWTSPETVINWNPGTPFYLEEGNFFMFASPLTMLLSIIVLIASWKSSNPMRFWLRMATIIFILVFIWSVAYFIPVQDVVKGDAGKKVPHEELGRMLDTFVWLNYLRQALLWIALGCALHALGLSYRQHVVAGTTS